jgi:uncharacterized protein (TIGR00269 family)
MIKPHEKVAVALSGGKDSVVLLHQLAELSKRLPMQLNAILIDEGIEGYRPATIEVAKKECKKLGVPLHIVSFKSAISSTLDKAMKKRKNNRVGACSFCGVFRRLLLNKKARELKCDKLALGHNLDDAVQTVLLNIYRNDWRKIERFAPVSIGEDKSMVTRIRPLIRIPEREVALMAELEGYGIRHQSCPYANEAMRQIVRRQLNEMEDRYPGTKKRIFNAWLEMEKNYHQKKKMDAKDKQELKKCKICKEPASKDECAACKIKREIFGLSNDGINLQII